ncbi:MAG: endonuclease [Kaiparowitsia implicata GSE-PSE-MK54-09C]|jgi:endonuclease I/V8-like Glu-specific endopeptidase|nr:endonuclease [Kaiparowitsia implicata GSE-PSE-MK54-09C]
MAIPQHVIQDTVERYQQRAKIRSSNLRKLDKGKLLEVDTAERVGRRLERLARNPIAANVLTEATNLPTAIIPNDEFRQLVQERILGQNDLMGIAYLEYGLAASHSVCRILLRDRRQNIIGYGTGFMVSPRLMMTNNHVIEKPQTAALSLAEFNYQMGMGGATVPSVTYSLNPEDFFLTSASLDYTLVTVNPSPSAGSGHSTIEQFGWNRLIEDQGKVILGEYVNIIQHPGGEPKQLALRENRLVDLLDDFLHYQTDTAPGSSGSPVFNDQWEVLGLHHSGVPRLDDNGNPLTVDGQLWTPSMGDDRIDWIANEGVRISRIVQHIKQQQSLNQVQRQLRSQLFDGTPPPRVSPYRSSALDTLSTAPAVALPNLDPHGVATWTIPLHVGVSLGNVPQSIAPPAPNTTPTAEVPLPPALPPSPPAFDDAPSEPDSSDGLNLDDWLGDDDSDADLRQDFELLEQLRRGEIVYYDEAADLSDRDDYYRDIAPQFACLSPAERFHQLNQLLEQTHARVLGYRPSAHLYPWVDLQPNLKLRSIYSQLEFSPEQIIQESLRMERLRAERLREKIVKEGLTDEQIATEIELLESLLPYNCEHVVPQSWYNRGQPMRGDLHHLFTCESRCNSFRGNQPYFDFPDYGETIRTDCGKAVGRLFEPESGKGEAARATLYFLLRYPGDINNTSQEYKAESLEVLLNWHRRFPVTEYERHRNGAIARPSRQGTRNPLIDFPDWADQIEFALGLGR